MVWGAEQPFTGQPQGALLNAEHSLERRLAKCAGQTSGAECAVSLCVPQGEMLQVPGLLSPAQEAPGRTTLRMIVVLFPGV